MDYVEMVSLVGSWPKHDPKSVTHTYDNYTVWEAKNGDRYLEAKDGSFHMFFRKADGFTAKWGCTSEDNPPYNPFGPEIADIELTKRCAGIRNVDGKHTHCPWCFPAGTVITMKNGDKIPIEQIKVGDTNLSLKFAPTGNRFIEGDVEKIFERDYEGELIIIELENGQKIECTPNHPILLRDGTEVQAKDLTGDEDLVIEEEYTHCKNCGKPKLAGKFFNRYYCSKECFDDSKKSCLICGNKVETKTSVFCRNCVPTSEGNSRHPLMNTWKTMMYRCYNPNRNKHQFYSDKNIAVCARWHIFENFLNDMGLPKDGETLDRIDNEKGYSPENCRWSAQREQKLNRAHWGKCKYKGVRKHGEKYVATIRINGISKYLGSFNTLEQAANAYNDALIANGDDKKYCNILEKDK